MGRAGLQLQKGVALGHSDQRRAVIRRGMNFGRAGRDEGIAFQRHDRLVHPAGGVLMVHNLAPDAEFAFYPKRKAFLAVLPQHWIFGSRTCPHIYLVRFQGDEARYLIAASAYSHPHFTIVTGAIVIGAVRCRRRDGCRRRDAGEDGKEEAGCRTVK